MIDQQQIFLNLFEPVKNNLWRYCLSISQNYNHAKDLLQETIEVAYKDFDKLQEQKSFLSRLFTIASRKNYAHKRKAYIESVEFDDDNFFMTNKNNNPETQTDVRLLYEALDKLPIEQKEAVILFEIVDLPQKEIADIQNVSIDTVKQRIHRGKNKLKELMNDDFSELSNRETHSEAIWKI